ncbi:MAG: ankyrin repeat domain-containing protein [Candidatus Micrarchaeota archaeon]
MTKQEQVAKARSDFRRLADSPLLVGAMHPADMFARAMAPPKKGTFETLSDAGKSRDGEVVKAVCGYLVLASANAGFKELVGWSEGLKSVLAEAKRTWNGRDLEVLMTAKGQVDKALDGKAREMDTPPAKAEGGKQNQAGYVPADKRLLDAAKKGDAEGVKEALDAGADPKATDESGKTAMDHAMGDAHPDAPWPVHPKVVEALQERMTKAA